ncbi:MAG: hypothetical protein ACRD0Z_06085 [Acidimicrobiales bacterium]
MPWVLTRRRSAAATVVAGLLAATLVLAAAPPRHDFLLVNVGGGSGGTSGSAIWSKAWWDGNPQGPGPYTGPSSGATTLCIWHDLGPSISDLNTGLSEASLPLSFWQVKDSGGHPGIWGVDQWGESELGDAGAPTDHFDLVACPTAGQVPVGAPDVQPNIPQATPPGGSPLYVWVFWDTVPDPPVGGLPGVVSVARGLTHLPPPTVETSPSSVGGHADATVVNLPTWLWIDASIWHSKSATASAGGLTATVWAIPQSVRWQARWDYWLSSQDRQGGTTFGPEVLDQVCDGPGSVYQVDGPADQATSCSFDFTQSTFGNSAELSASITWDVYWALSDAAGVVGGEGSLGQVVTTSGRSLRVLQVESVITDG